MFQYNYLFQASMACLFSSILLIDSASSGKVIYNFWRSSITILHLYHPVDDKSMRQKLYTETTETGVYVSQNSLNFEGGAVILQPNVTKRNDQKNVIVPEDAVDKSGCFPPFLENYPKNESWIAVVTNDQCSIEDKVRNAHTLNASGLLIYDAKEERPLFSMAVTQMDLPLPVVFTHMWKGKEIVRKLDTKQKVYLKLRKELFCQAIREFQEASKLLFHCKRRNYYHEFEEMNQAFDMQIPSWILPRKNTKKAKNSYEYKLHITIEGFSVVCSAFVISILTAWIILRIVRYVAQIRHDLMENRLDRQFSDQAARVLKKIPTTVFDEANFDGNENSIDNCAICIEKIEDGDITRLLPCSHLFHQLCIDPWLLDKGTCPLCKMNLLRHYGIGMNIDTSALGSNSTSQHGPFPLHQID